jgi:hypothetical protein
MPKVQTFPRHYDPTGNCLPNYKKGPLPNSKGTIVLNDLSKRTSPIGNKAGSFPICFDMQIRTLANSN